MKHHLAGVAGQEQNRIEGECHQQPAGRGEE